MDLFGDFAVVFEHDRPEELVVVTAEDNLFHFCRQVVEVLQVNAVALDLEKLVDHGLVGPLVQKRSDRVLFPVKDQQMCFRRVAAHLGHEFSLSIHLCLHSLGEVLAQGAVIVEPDQWVRSCRHQNSKNAVHYPVGGVLLD